MKYMKKIMAAVIMAAVIATTITSEACEHFQREYDNQFADVTGNEWYADAAIYMYKLGSVNGKDSAHFCPKDVMSRAMVATIVWRSAGEPKVAYSNVFGDIPENSWYTQAVMYSYYDGILTGYQNGNFGPADGMTREQMVTILYRITEQEFGKQETNGSLNWYIDKNSVSDWAEPAMSWAVEYGIIKGKENGMALAPQDRLTRAEFVVMYVRWIQSDCYLAA